MMQPHLTPAVSTPLPMPFIERLQQAWQTSNSLLCVGLDPDPARFPAPFTGQSDKIFDFCRAIVDATAPYACSFKPQIAYFAAHAAEDQLVQLISYIKSTYPSLPVILDAKRGDIGSTAAQYAREAFERFNADAVTVNPYMGFDSVVPYLAYPERGVIVLCRTSNPGGSDLQNLIVQTPEGAHKLYQEVAKQVAHHWNSQQQCALVVGGTFPDELAEVRRIVGQQMPILVPGIGTQGGDMGATLKAGCNSLGNGLMINVSRAILYPSSEADWRQAVAHAAQRFKEEINSIRMVAP